MRNLHELVCCNGDGPPTRHLPSSSSLVLTNRGLEFDAGRVKPARIRTTRLPFLVRICAKLAMSRILLPTSKSALGSRWRLENRRRRYYGGILNERFWMDCDRRRRERERGRESSLIIARHATLISDHAVPLSISIKAKFGAPDDFHHDDDDGESGKNVGEA